MSKNRSDTRLSVGSAFLGCAVLYVIAATGLAALIGQPWMPRPVRIVIAVLILLGLVAYVLMAIMYLIGRRLGLTGPTVERGEPPLGLHRLMLRFYVPYLRWKGHYKQFERRDMEPIEDVIRRAAEDGAIELDLSERLMESLPDELWQFTQLEELSLYGNLLTHISGIGQLANLRELALDDNQFPVLPPELSQLKSLTYLSMGGNQFKTLPP